MDQKIMDYLKANDLVFQVFQHEPTFKVEQSRHLLKELPGLPTKNLFMKDESNNHYLISLYAEKMLDTKLLKNTLEKKKLSFCSEEELKSYLNTSPGSVSLLEAIYDESTILIIDKAIVEAESVRFHPNSNTSSILLDKNNLNLFLDTLENKKIIIEL